MTDTPAAPALPPDDLLRARLPSLLAKFAEQGQTHVYLARCCGRTFVGIVEPKTCRTCGQVPRSSQVPVTASPEEQAQALTHARA